jgi:hypothetical protein
VYLLRPSLARRFRSLKTLASASAGDKSFGDTLVIRESKLIGDDDFEIRPHSNVTSRQHVYEIRPRKDKRGVDLISDALPFGDLWYAGPNAVNHAIGYAKHRSRSWLN